MTHFSWHPYIPFRSLTRKPITRVFSEKPKSKTKEGRKHGRSSGASTNPSDALRCVSSTPDTSLHIFPAALRCSDTGVNLAVRRDSNQQTFVFYHSSASYISFPLFLLFPITCLTTGLATHYREYDILSHQKMLSDVFAYQNSVPTRTSFQSGDCQIPSATIPGCRVLQVLARVTSPHHPFCFTNHTNVPSAAR